MSYDKDLIIAKEKARQQYDSAFHLLNVTFPLVKDPKLLMGIIYNIFSSMEYSMDAILNYEKQLRLVPQHSNVFQSKFNIFRLKSVRRNNIPGRIITQMMEVKELIELHKQSPTEFQRGNRFVICTKDYRMKVISLKDIRNQLDIVKEFLDLSEKITSKFG
jgi:hypothetical protein